MAPRKVMIDCDAGVDDALALLLAFHSPELDVEAVTGVHGNVPLELVFLNIQRVLSLLRPSHKPLIAKGADRPLQGSPVHAYSVHGRDGLGEARISPDAAMTWWQLSPLRADELMIHLAHQFPHEITLVAIGPLTNVALAIQKDPAGMEKLEEVVIMGGAVRTGGNITPYAEFNIFADPLAAHIVFGSRCPVTLVPLDITRQVFLNAQVVEERVKPMKSPFAQFLTEATGYDSTTRRFRGGMESFHLHDPLAVGCTIAPPLVIKERLSIQVDIGQGDSLGRTLECSGDRKMSVGLNVDSEKFLDLFLTRLGG